MSGYFRETEPTKVVSVLGTEYKIYLDVPDDADEVLEHCSGFCDKTGRIIVVGAQPEEANFFDWRDYAKQILRHELIHAFFFESGLCGDSVWHVEGHEHPEQTVEWLARQFPKMIRTFEEAGAL